MGVVETVGRNREVRLYERLNDQLTIDNNFLREQLITANDRIDELKAQLDIQLGLVQSIQTGDIANYKPVGGRESFAKRAANLSLASYNKARENEEKDQKEG